MNERPLARVLDEANVTGRAADAIRTFAALLVRHGRVQRLTGCGTAEAVAEHVAEALAAVAVVREAGPAGGPWVDVGSGGGLPGLVVAAVWDGPVTLVEPRARRAAFLEYAALQMGVGAEVVAGRLEAEGWTGPAAELAGRAVAVASARAVFAPDVWLERSRVLGHGVVRTVHLAANGRVPRGWRALARRRTGRWQVAAVLPEDVSRETNPVEKP